VAFPGVFVNAEHGQNGFLTTALLGGGLLMLERQRPVLAGLLFGLLSYKPQFGVLLPIALAVGFHWRAFISAAATSAVAACLSCAIFGVETWRAFLASLPLTTGYVLEGGAAGWEKMQSAFTAVRMLGGTIGEAYAAQGLMVAIAAVAVVLVWRRPISVALKGSVLAIATLLATPYVFDYDLVLLTLPIAWIAAEARSTGFFAWEKIGLAVAFALPLVSRPVGSLGIPIGPVVLVLLLGLILKRALSSSVATASPAQPVPLLS